MPRVKLKAEFVNVEPYGPCEVLVVPPMSPVTERRHYGCADTTVHPAKMSVMLCRELIRRYTREGDTVLDPMVGIGTTLVESVLLGRNAIGIELEDKFVKITEGNITLLKKLKAPSLGCAKVIKGDARRLTKLLGAEVDCCSSKIDTAVFSPPFERMLAGMDKSWGEKHRGGGTRFTQLDYGKNPKNIGRLKYGKPVDAIVTSPPFGEAHSSSDSGVPNGCAKEVFSKRSWLKGDNPKSINNLKYGKPVDAVVFSPPFSEQIRNEHVGKDSNWAKMVNRKYGHMEAPQGKENIANLKYGKPVDVVITSPPYSGSYLGGGNVKARKERLARAGYDPNYYLGGRARNTVLKHYTEVDSIVTSPPYEASVCKGEGPTVTSIKNKPDESRFSGLSCYSDSERNIGNQKGATYLSEMKKVYEQCFSVLKQGGLMVLVLKVFVRNKKIQRLDLDTLKLCNAVGFRLVDVKLFRLRQRSFWRILQLRKFGDQIKDKYLLDFEIIQFFEKTEGGDRNA